MKKDPAYPAAKKSLGQHFLHNKQILEKIADSVDVSVDVVVEIGPGHGELTQLLCARHARVVVIEKDHTLVPLLREKFGNRVLVNEGDALEILPGMVRDFEKEGVTYAVVGNIPYYISGYLFRMLGDVLYKPMQGVFLIQKEVAQRICAQAGGMNLLAACIQAWSSPRILFSVGSGNFNPPPKVDSAVIALESIHTDILASHPHFFEFLRVLFKQPRKTVGNNLKEVSEYVSTLAKIEAQYLLLRPERLSLIDMQRIYDVLYA